jgi:polysaccharide biosynthesis protein PslH
MNKICLLSITPYRILPANMGGQKGIALFNEHLAKEVTLYVASVKSNDVSKARGYKMLPVLSDSPLRYINLFYFFTLRTIIKKKSIRHVIIEHPYYGWLGILLKWFCSVKLIVHSHNIESLRFKSTGRWWWRILWWYEKKVHQLADMSFFIHEEDRSFAISQYKINPSKCVTITYGFEQNTSPSSEERKKARAILEEKYAIGSEDSIILFNGTLHYKPNLDALDIILQKINPTLLSNRSFSYKIIICGKGLPESYHNLKDYTNKNVIYAGFVDDINLYFKGSNIFLNPVSDGGGIKTKLVEALGYNMNVVTTKNGAIGVPVSVTGDKMNIMNENNWQQFANAILRANSGRDIPMEFFEHFYWGAIGKKAVDSIKNMSLK